MELARTMSGLSPVARMESPSRVRRNRISSTHTTAAMAAARMSLYAAAPPRRFLNMEKIVSVLSMFTLAEKPITARFTV